MTEQLQPLVVGAGPAGIRAAQALVRGGLRPVIIDEGYACGGQIYRQPLVADGRDGQARYGSEADKAAGLHAAFAALGSQIDYFPNSLVWNLRDGFADIATGRNYRRIPYDGLIMATGATDRILPVPGWTLPGVFTLGGAQIALKTQGCSIGKLVVFAGTGPLLYLVAWQYLKVGINVAAVLDASRFLVKARLMVGLLSRPSIVLRGLRFAAELRMRGVKLHHGIDCLRFEGQSRIESVSWRSIGRTHRLPCDGAGYGLALRSETQLADIAGCNFRFDKRDRAWLPVKDISGRTSLRSVYVAGDGSGIVGADAAEWAGERAALALCEDRGITVPQSRVATLEGRLRRVDRFREHLESAFPFPAHWASRLEDDTQICRCEEVTVGTARQVRDQFGVTEINRLKALSRVGMGRCQGRMCGAVAAELLAQETGRNIDAVGRLRSQPPVKPLALTQVVAASAGSIK